MNAPKRIRCTAGVPPRASPPIRWGLLLPMLGAVTLSLGFGTALWRGALGPRAVRFSSESVVLDVREAPERTLLVAGAYQLRNSGPTAVALPIRFPWPAGVDTELVGVDADGHPLSAKVDHNEAHFVVPVPARGEVQLRVVYRQRLAERAARYLVMTTREWGVPLERAEFRVTLPVGCVLTETSDPIDLRTGAGVAAPFWPTQDLALRWSCPAKAEPQ